MLDRLGRRALAENRVGTPGCPSSNSYWLSGFAHSAKMDGSVGLLGALWRVVVRTPSQPPRHSPPVPAPRVPPRGGVWGNGRPAGSSFPPLRPGSALGPSRRDDGEDEDEDTRAVGLPADIVAVVPLIISPRRTGVSARGSVTAPRHFPPPPAPLHARKASKGGGGRGPPPEFWTNSARLSIRPRSRTAWLGCRQRSAAGHTRSGEAGSSAWVRLRQSRRRDLRRVPPVAQLEALGSSPPRRAPSDNRLRTSCRSRRCQKMGL